MPDVPDILAPGLRELDQQRLLVLLGYNVRRASLAITSHFLKRMQEFGLRPVEFSILLLLDGNEGVAPKQLSATLNVSPPNMAVLLARLEERGLIKRGRLASDRRQQEVALTEAGRGLALAAEEVAHGLEVEASARLTPAERADLMQLLQKVFLPR